MWHGVTRITQDFSQGARSWQSQVFTVQDVEASGQLMNCFMAMWLGH